MKSNIEREAAIELLRRTNKEPFHLRHALTVEGVMRWYAAQLGYEAEAEDWGLVGLLHDVDFELYPERHCLEAPEMLRSIGASEEFIHAVCSHAYGSTVDIEPVHQMEKVLFATDELTGLIGATVLMLPSRDIADLQMKSIKKKFKDKRFAAGCSREIITQGAQMLGWEMDKLFGDTIEAMKSCDAAVNEELESWV